MLIEFKVENFKAFLNEVVFNMKPEPIKDIDYSVLKEKINGKEIKALSSSVIYGANASGKTSIINAMSCFKQIILRGNIFDLDENRFGDYVSANMTLIPFAFLDKETPTSFDITFTYDKNKYNYFLKLELGLFSNKDFNRKIIEEKLYVNDKKIFIRTENDINVSNYDYIKDFLLEGFDEKLARKNINISNLNLSKTTLFLTSDFDSYISKKIANNIKTWLNEQFIVINKADKQKIMPNFEVVENTAIIESDINEIAKLAGIIGTDFAYGKALADDKVKLVSVFKHDNESLKVLPSEFIESVGTIRLIELMPYIFKTMKNGGILVMDEFDSSLHPMIIMNIINIFHNDEININNAQLVFNTHNPIYLNSSIFRRDEIKFVERDKTTKSTILYSLSDFKTNGKVSVRNTTDYMKNYFVSRYGAIEDIDFSDVFRQIIKKDV